MSYYHDRKNAEDYIKMAEGYDGRELIERLKEHLPPGSTVLELGMGPGTDLEILAENYGVTGSDNSPVFLGRYRQTHPHADLMQLDAITLATARRFDCIYSNKVLHHLTRSELAESLRKQIALLNERGVLLHSFWAGDHVEEMHGLRFVYYTEQTLGEIIDDAVGDEFEVVECRRFTEMTVDDSLYIILCKRRP